MTLEQDGPHNLLRLAGQIDVPTAADLKRLLLEALAAGRDLHVDLEQVEDLNVTALQLFWTLDREAKAAGLRVTVAGRIPDAITALVGDAGFASFPILAESSQG